MYCGKCGAKNEAGAAFCGSCGAPLGAEGTSPAAPAAAGEVNPKPAAVQSASKNKKIGIIAVAAVAIALVFAVFSLFGGRSDVETAEQFVDAVFDMDAKEILSLLPKDVVNMMEESGYSKADLVEELSGMAEGLQSSFLPMDFLSEKIDLDYDAVGASDVDLSQLTYLKERYNEEVGMKITAARKVNVSMRIQIDDLDIDMDQMMQIPVIKSGGKWYIDVMSF